MLNNAYKITQGDVWHTMSLNKHYFLYSLDEINNSCKGKENK